MDAKSFFHNENIQTMQIRSIQKSLSEDLG